MAKNAPNAGSLLDGQSRKRRKRCQAVRTGELRSDLGHESQRLFRTDEGELLKFFYRGEVRVLLGDFEIEFASLVLIAGHVAGKKQTPVEVQLLGDGCG